MIETLAKAFEVSYNAPDQKTQKNAYNPDNRLESGSDDEIVKKSEKFDPDERIVDVREKIDGFYTSYEDRIKCTNLDSSEGGLRGSWTGERGESVFIPSYQYMKNELAKYGVKGIEFKSGEADFSPFSVASVKINNMTHERLGPGGNFEQADKEFAKEFNKMRKNNKTDWTAIEVREYREANKLTPHENCDCETVELIPTKIHKYFKHSGGVAECRVRDGIRGDFDE